MNKFARVICMIAVVALAFTSCKKKENENACFKGVTTQQFVDVYEDEEEGAKAYFEGNQILFEVGDSLELIAFGTEHATQNTYKLDDTGWWLPEESTYVSEIGANDAWYAFYPAGNANGFHTVSTLTGDHYQATFRVADVQEYREGKVPENAMYMACKDDTHKTLQTVSLNFSNICGILSMKFYSPTGKKVKSIELIDNKLNVAGDITCNIDQIDANELTSLCNSYSFETCANPAYYEMLHNQFGYAIANGKRSIKLNCENAANPNGVALGTTKSTATRFLMVMRPMALVKGMTIKVNYMPDEYDETPAPTVINSVKDNRIKPNIIKNMTVYNVG